ncbi:hypothetical protein WNY37_16860 [Henriciella sp. AS95]|uniref:hypothetical protein n=1 Tax=Henriciella sp. AS95 TaxID=3135782 RepID=UPI0031750D77
MILQRLATSIRKQDWFTVLIETLIVVLGVFLGIQLGNWNAARAEQRLAESYTVRLIADLEQDLSASRRLTSYYDAVTQSIVDADRMLSLTDPDPKALIVAAYRASEFTYTPKRRATWDQIVSSGDLDLLPNDMIASGLSDYYKFDEAADDTISRLQDTPYRLSVRFLVPLPIQLEIRDGCSDDIEENSNINGFVAECRIAVDDSLLEDTASALLESNDLQKALRYQYSMVAAVQVNNRGDVFALNQLLAALKEETAP